MNRSIISVLVAASLTTVSATASADNSWKNEAKDAWIDGKAETTLLLNGNLNSFTINTDVKNGEVTLTGTVESDVDKALAEELVSSLDGVSDVDNQLTVKADKEQKKDSKIMKGLKDSKVETVVKTRLLFESEVSGLDIEVEAKDGVVTLSGKVETDAERDLAIAIAKNTNDVKRVNDELHVAS
ncbi:BON domain-containing protein [Neptunicella marina]|uniref:BON domain-containing protein n=1 Tax=Neptunicella marina TaxID=2125989 RepID=A0A8J6M3F4_9ALTE|nr:BON domain-containing protein [Neptunicella marina]MBC3765336.1 BON domain-containing protein [Neptunicella marina]